MVRSASFACAMAFFPLGCGVGAFACQGDAQCGDAGQCEPQGWCSFPDPRCPGGRRFGSHSGDGLGGTCVPSQGDAGTGSDGPTPSTGDGTVVVSSESSSAADTSLGVEDPSTTSTSAGTFVSDPGTTSTGEVADPDLLLWLDFDDDAAPYADRSQYGRATSCDVDGCPTLEAGIDGNAARFDGIDDVLLVDEALAMPADFCLALWIAVDALPTEVYQDVFTRAFGPTNANSWGFGFPPSLTLMRFVVHDGDAQFTVGQVQWPERGGWHHVAGTWDGATATFYFDGMLVATRNIASIGYDDHAVGVGADLESDVLVNYFAGVVDDVRIYDRALSEAEIAVLASG